jgi:lipopolysaccharide/colanic/teichoic acid biosynthesis glycosyltransferase
VRPGITSLAAIVYRDEEEMLSAYSDPLSAYGSQILPKKLELNRLYAAHVSLKLDLAIIGLTLLSAARPADSRSLAERLAGKLRTA